MSKRFHPETFAEAKREADRIGAALGRVMRHARHIEQFAPSAGYLSDSDLLYLLGLAYKAGRRRGRKDART